MIIIADSDSLYMLIDYQPSGIKNETPMIEDYSNTRMIKKGFHMTFKK